MLCGSHFVSSSQATSPRTLRFIQLGVGFPYTMGKGLLPRRSARASPKAKASAGNAKKAAGGNNRV